MGTKGKRITAPVVFQGGVSKNKGVVAAFEKALNCPVTVDENGQDICVYHARNEETITGDPLYNPNRHARLMPVVWDEEGKPVFSFNRGDK